MPLINVIRGERLSDAVLNVRTPIVRIPLWLALTGWTVRGFGRLVVMYVRLWYVTVPATLVAWLWYRYGWVGPAAVGAGGFLIVGLWAVLHRPSFVRLAWFPVLGRWRRIRYRRRWYAAMATSRLAVTFDGRVILPVLERVRVAGSADMLTVRMVTGQVPEDFARVGERLAHTFGAMSCRVSPGPRPELLMVGLLRGDPLAAVIPPLPVADTPNLAALPLGQREDGQRYLLRLLGTQVLVVGATGAGKGSVIWSLIRTLAGGVRTGLVQLWAIDPKGGMELGGGLPLFSRFACTEHESMAGMLEAALEMAQARAARLRTVTRQHVATPDEPLIVIIIDELAALTAYLTDRKVKDRFKAALGLLLTQGRAVGVHVVAALQDPRKEVLPFRDLFPTRIGLRMSEEAQVDMVLGEGARDRGALCDRIPVSTPGVGYVVLDGDPTPARVRFSYLDDDDIGDLACAYGRPRGVDGEVIGA
jgi:S-DNA-T family DNA segregation ATPase FtsK/SpoIIIE